jgi:hypothetical protein
VPIVGIGTATMQDNSQEEFAAVVETALDQGITYVDTAPQYGNTQAKLGPIVARRREEIFLVTKVDKRTKDDALRQVEESLKLLRTDRLDLVHLHGVGYWDGDEGYGPDGALAGLEEARRKGMVRFIGASSHHRPARFLPAIETGKIDVLMPTINYVDRFTYDFEGKILPLARERRIGLVAMKVLGGPIGFKYHPAGPALLRGPDLEGAFRYALSLEGIACAVIGMREAGEAREAARIARSFKPLEPPELERLLETGKTLAKEWGPHFGPVA